MSTKNLSNGMKLKMKLARTVKEVENLIACAEIMES